ncbi:MAG: UDP-3-O-(3-hydroxymyristoyl)glucosamine N-acyltransferase, partial [Porticoccaceae bacterium]|nr:UDP-3-O-(3-hydroxymyristoyl)glucosamine N-acyltransferase [Porticoccaceae bacterium]
MSTAYRAADIAAFLEIELRGDPDTQISGLGTLDSAEACEISFLANRRYSHLLAKCRAGAVILAEPHIDSFAGVRLVSRDPYLSYAKLTEWFVTAPQVRAEVHKSAVIAADATVANDCYIGAHVVIGAGVSIARGCYIGANSTIGERSSLGFGCRIENNVAIYHDVVIGRQVTVHSGSVIGSDGFGFAPDGTGGWQKIHQIGGVEVGDYVEIG